MVYFRYGTGTIQVQGKRMRRRTMSKKVISDDEYQYIMAKDNSFELLGVSANATTREIKIRYHALILEFHPDKVDINSRERATDIAKKLNDAYEKCLAANERCSGDENPLYSVFQFFKMAFNECIIPTAQENAQKSNYR